MGELLSPVEAILQNILGADNILVPPGSQVEEILQAIYYNTEYENNPKSRVAEILLAIKNKGVYDGPVLSRVEDILVHKLNNIPYTKHKKEDLSRVEQLLLDWLEQGGGEEIIEYTGMFPMTILANGEPLLDYIISGNAVQSGTPSPDNPVMPQGTGERTGNLFDIESWITANGTTYTKSGNSYTFDTRQSMYSTPYYFSETDIAISISGILENVSSVNARIDLLHADGTVSSGNVITDSQAKSENIYAAGLRFNWSTGGTVTLSNIMLNSGSTALPYEPYGIKIPISSGGENLFPQDSLMGKSSVVQTAFNEIGSSIVFNNGQYVLSMNVTTEATSGVFKVCFTYTDGSQDKSQWITYRTSSIVLVSNGTKVVKSISITDYNNYIDIAFSSIMLNRGSEALPYEPYNRTTTPIYLGEVESTRRIKKLVLTGEENWDKGTYAFYRVMTGIAAYKSVLCTHYQYYEGASSGAPIDSISTVSGGGMAVWIKTQNHSDTTIEQWKSYLTAQYDAGTPVTVWYVLANEETAVVNEPLMRIGDYSDTLSYAQAGVQIPTNKKPTETVIDIPTSVKPSEGYIKYTELSDGPAPKTPVLGTKNHEIYMTSNDEVYVLRR